MSARRQVELARAYGYVWEQGADPLERPSKGLMQAVSPQPARIYRKDGSWWSIQPDPSGGEIRCRYPSGQAAMVALDPRNREKATRAITPQMRQLTDAAVRIRERWLDGLLRLTLDGPGTKNDYVLATPREPETKDCE